ncbi:nucleotidyltransferase family protein [Flavicella sp.]|uniref:nucleotidyltransferase family protein n=1 Tax=Flavicella sp. TaxID=2957742 RepID=UPI002606D6AC|nr:nucleotidyltransferase family protein [Flavicella sp.]MDG1805574.1 nucleotidyltransferase family protein [Flavicella sp.]
MKYKIACLILAAGKGTRMGSQKQLLTWNDTTLIGNMIDTASAVFDDDIFVVLGSGKNEIQNQLSKYNIQEIDNTSWKQGIGSSISVGIKKLEGYQGVLILLADQVFLEVDHLKKMLHSFELNEGKIIASTYNNMQHPAVPMLFDQIYFDVLMELNGNIGAKKLMKMYKTSVVQIDTAIDFMDVDTPEDYAKYSEKNKLK